MRTIEQFEKNINNLDANFNKLISNDSLNINSTEELAYREYDDNVKINYINQILIYYQKKQINSNLLKRWDGKFICQ